MNDPTDVTKSFAWKRLSGALQDAGNDEATSKNLATAVSKTLLDKDNLTHEVAVSVFKTLRENNLRNEDIAGTLSGSLPPAGLAAALRDGSRMEGVLRPTMDSASIARVMCSNEGGDLSPSATAVGLRDGLNLDPSGVAKAMSRPPTELSLEDVTYALSADNGLALPAATVAKALYEGAEVRENRVAELLQAEAGAPDSSIYSALRDGCNLPSEDAAWAMHHGASMDEKRIAAAMIEVDPHSAAEIAKTLHSLGDQTPSQIAGALLISSGAGLAPDAVALALKDGLNMRPNEVAGALYDVSFGVSAGEVAKALRDGLDLNSKEVAHAMYSMPSGEMSAEHVAQGLKDGLDLPSSEVVQALMAKEGANISPELAYSVLRDGFNASPAEAVESMLGVYTLDEKQIADAMRQVGHAEKEITETFTTVLKEAGRSDAEIKETLEKAQIKASPSVQGSDNAARIEDAGRLTGKLTSVEPTSDPQRDLVHVQRAGVDVSVSVPTASVSRSDVGYPIKLRYEPKAGLQVEAGPQASRNKAMER